MTRAPFTWAVALSVALSWGCGGEERDPELEAAIQAWGLGAAGRRAVPVAETVSGCNTLVVFAIDRVTKRELSFARVADPSAESATPNLDAIAAGAEIAPDAFTTSTAGNAAVASLLTGLTSPEHGVASLRHNGRATLGDHLDTLPEVLAADNWRTLASMSSPRHARGFSGFAQGFETYEAPRVGERARSPAAVANGGRMALDAALAAGGKVFALYTFDGPGANLDLDAYPQDLLVAAARRRFEPLAGRNATVDAAIARLVTEPAEALADLDRSLRRARGSDLSDAWVWARREAMLASIDQAVGDVLGQLDAHGRGEHAMVAIVGLRGDELPGDAPSTGPWFRPDVVQVPVALRYPCGATGNRGDGPSSLIDVPRVIADTFGYELAEAEVSGPPDAVIVCDAGLSTTMLVTSDELLERRVDGETILYSRADQQPLDAADRGEAPRIGFGDRAPVTCLRFWSSDPHVPVELRWHVSEGQMRPPVNGARPAARGRIELPPADHPGVTGRSPAATLSHRSAAVRLEIALPDDEATALERVQLGETRASDLPVLLTSVDSPEPLADGVDPVVEWTRSDGLWWTMSVRGEGPTEALVSVYPPRDPTHDVEVRTGGAAILHPVRGRLDLVRVTGIAPFEIETKKLGKERFAVACRVDGRFVQPHEIVFHGLALGSESEVAIVLTDGLRVASESLPSVDLALYGAEPRLDADLIKWITDPPPSDCALQVWRSAPGGPPPANGALDLDGLEFVRRLPPGE